MPRPFDSREEAAIRDSLRETGRDLFRRNGLAGTTIDALARAAGIAKGSFYKFYSAKEILYFELLEDAHEALRQPLLRDEPAEGRDRAWLAAQFKILLQRSLEEPLIRNLAEGGTMQTLYRRIPPERLQAHQIKDQQFLDALIEKWSPPDSRPDRDQIAARMTMAAMVSLQPQFFGERLHGLALDAAITSLVDCIYPGAD
jgi:AcrR family transcriptional regulator